MSCETCGNPIDREDAERGTCGHCGAVLAHVLRAAEKAELVRRVVAQGNDVRIDGDRIEARAPPGPPREGPDGAILEARSMSFGVAAALAIIFSAGLVAYITVVHRSAPPTTPGRTAAPEPPALIAEPVPPVVAQRSMSRESPAPASTLAVKGAEPASKPSPAPSPPPHAPAAAAPRTVEGVVAAHKPEYDRCQHAEVARNPAAARRYSVAITVDTQGRAEWVELLSEASSEMRSCVQTVTRGLGFPKAAAGSSRSIVTLSFTGTP